MSIESELLPRTLCQRIFERALAAAQRQGVDDLEITFHAGEEALTRFANNVIHQNVAERSLFVSLRPMVDHRTARVTTNRLDEPALQQAVEDAIRLARASEPNPDLLPLYADDQQADSARFSAAAAASTPQERACAVREAVQLAAARGQTAAGIYSVSQSAEALLNSAGLFRYYAETNTRFSMTAMTEDSSGWAKASSPDHSAVDPLALARRAVEKAERSRRPRELPPGEYTVVLEPAAVLDLVGQIFMDFSATAIADRRSFLTGRERGRLFGPNIAIYDHVSCPLQSGPAFDGEGVPRKNLTLVENGWLKEIPYSRAAAAKAGVEPTGHGFPLPNELGEAPVNIVMAGDRASIEDLVRSTERGILVTRLWYIREVEPYEKVMTGMTRDGTFLIEGGELVTGLRNFRFNQSVVALLNQVEALSESVRASGEEAFDMVVPGMKCHGFRFTEVTKF
jgi:predicted Zn-dependent protease